MKRIILFFLLNFLHIGLLAQQIEFEEYDLANGLHVITQHADNLREEMQRVKGVFQVNVSGKLKKEVSISKAKSNFFS